MLTGVRNHTRRLTIIALIVACAAGGWYFLARPDAHSEAPPPRPQAVPVTEGTARAQNVPVFLQGIGAVQAINTVNVKTRVDGQIMQAFFTQGQEVRQNEKLFLIDPRPYQAALDMAKANLTKDAAQLQGAERDLTRYAKLVGSGFQTRQSFEDQQATVAQLQGAIQADDAAVETARLNLSFTTIRAPISGRTGALLVDPGNYIQTSAATPLVSITQIKPIYLAFNLPATNLDTIRASQAGHALQVDAYGADGTTLLATGVLSFIDNHVDTSTGTIALKATFQNADERLWPGEFVNARLILAIRHDAVTVPVETVMAGANGSYVYVIGPDDKVTRRNVTLASRQDGLAVIAKGITAGERVVVAGQYRLANNVKVRPAAAQPATPATPATQGATQTGTTQTGTTQGPTQTGARTATRTGNPG